MHQHNIADSVDQPRAIAYSQHVSGGSMPGVGAAPWLVSFPQRVDQIYSVAGTRETRKQRMESSIEQWKLAHIIDKCPVVKGEICALAERLSSHIDDEGYYKGTLDIIEQNWLISLPKNLRVTDDLVIDLCGNLKHLPDNLVVKGDLRIYWCINVACLPKDLRVDGEFDTWGCDVLRVKASDLNEVRGRIIFGGTTPLPEDLHALRANRDGSPRVVDLATSDFSSPEMIKRLWQTATLDVHLLITAEDRQAFEKGHPCVYKSFERWKAILDDAEEYNPLATCPWLHGLADSDGKQLDLFLDQLAETDEYQDVDTRVALAARVMTMLMTMDKDKEFRAVACEVIHNGLATCSDRVITALDDIDIQVRIKTAEDEVCKHKDVEGMALYQLAQQLLRLEKVDSKAQAWIQKYDELLKQEEEAFDEADRVIDPVETQLACRLKLKDKLDLPISTQNMMYRGHARITDKEIDMIGEEIRAEERVSDGIQTFLASWAPWGRHQRRCEVWRLPYDKLDTTGFLSKEDASTCAITLEVPENPVRYTHICYEYQALEQHYINTGKDPVTNLPMDWRNVLRY